MGFTITGNIVIIDNSGITHTIDVEDMDFDNDSEENAPMGPKTTHRGTWDNGNVEVTVDIEEYPIGTNNGIIIDVEGGVLSSNNIKTEITE